MNLREVESLGRGRQKVFGIYYKTCLIYKLENLVNGKVYIGLSRAFSKRIKSYLYHSREDKTGQIPIHRAIKKHGKENFSLAILEYGIPDNDLENRERAYISEFKSNDREFGYNLTSGGESPKPNEENKAAKSRLAKNKKPVSLYDIMGKRVISYSSINDCAREENLKHCTVRMAIKEGCLIKGKFMVREGDEETITPFIDNRYEGTKVLLKGNRNCKTFEWRLVNVATGEIFEADGLRKISLLSGLTADALRSMAYNRKGYLDIKEKYQIIKLEQFTNEQRK